MKRLLGVLLALSAATAWAVPPTMPFAGRLSTSGGPVSGPVAVTFRLFATATGGTPVWSETHPSLTAVNGLVYAELGALTSLDVTVLDGQARYLELVVGTETLSPRITLASLPYAFRADTCEHVGTAAEADLQRRVAGTCGTNAAIRAIDATGQVTCANLAGVTAGTGIAVNGSTVSLSSSGCGPGYVWRYDGAQFACVADAVGPTYTPGVGIGITGGAISLSAAGCPPNGVWHYTGTTWTCTADDVTTNASALTTGTLSTSLYSAYADLSTEGYLDNSTGTDLLTQAQGDTRYLNSTGDTATGNLVAPDFRYSTARTGYLSIASMAVIGAFWHHTGFGESYPNAVGVNCFGTVAVNPPHGATITGFSCVLRDGDPAHRIDVSLRRVTDSTDTVVANLTTGDAYNNLAWVTFSDTSIVTPVVDNLAASYYLELMGHNATSNVVGIRRCTITYTTPAPAW